MDNELFQLAEKCGHQLTAQCLKIATAESCTGGLIAKTMTDVPGSSGWFERGYVTYSNLAKIQNLGVNPDTVDQFGAVSAEIAEQMAVGLLLNSAADWAISVTGIAGPDGGSELKPVGTVYVTWSGKSGFKQTERLQLEGHRQQIRLETTRYVLIRLSQFLDESLG